MNTPPPDFAPSPAPLRMPHAGAWAVGVLALLCVATGAAAAARTAAHAPARFVIDGPAPVLAAAATSRDAAPLQPLEDCVP